MSDLLRTVNLIKMKHDGTWLTLSQQHTLGVLKDLLRTPGRVNLYGASGVGKTFLAWALAEELGYMYFAHMTLFEQAEQLDTQGIIVDNADPGHQAHRDALKLLGFRDVRYAVLVTREAVQDYAHCVELTLTPGDQAQVRANLSGIGVLRTAVDMPNLWVLVNQALVGGRDV